MHLGTAGARVGERGGAGLTILTAVVRAGRAARSGVRWTTGALLEGVVRCAAAGGTGKTPPPADPPSIFVLRNNDIGDLLVITPMFEALRRRFPRAILAAGVGDWSRDVLLHNPHVTEILPVNAPWFNKYSRRNGASGPLVYLCRSPELPALAVRRFAVGVDVLGSSWGALLLLKAGIPYRMGIRGYAGGHSAAQATVDYDPSLHVGRTALRFAELLGARDLPPCRPQIFLDPAERELGEHLWNANEPPGRRRPRVLVGPGGGLAAKCWPAASFAALVSSLAGTGEPTVLVVGGPREEELVASVAGASPAARHLPRAPTLRAVFALAAAADLVICNSSMLLHAAAAFARPTLVLLGAGVASARDHQLQWGYPGVCRSLGKEPGRRSNVYTPEEALAVVRAAMADNAPCA
jgi:ADP-heptose:LPS heptosyltransferase